MMGDNFEDQLWFERAARRSSISEQWWEKHMRQTKRKSKELWKEMCYIVSDEERLNKL